MPEHKFAGSAAWAVILWLTAIIFADGLMTPGLVSFRLQKLHFLHHIHDSLTPLVNRPDIY